MSGRPSRPPRTVRRLLSVAWPGTRGSEAQEELDRDYLGVAERNGASAAWLWYAGQLLRPSTWWLAWELRRGPGGGLGFSLLDLKLGARMLRKQPMLTGVAVLALGLGIPASLSVTHLWRAQLAPIPGEGGERIMAIRHWDTRSNRDQRGTLEDFLFWRDEVTTFSTVAATRSVEWNVRAEDGQAEPIRGAEITANGFDILRVPPAMGRTIVAADEVPGAPDVVVLSHDLWVSLGRDPDVVGQTVRVSGVPHEVVGVMPEGFLFPRRHRLWIPLRLSEEAVPGSQGFLWTFGRLTDGVSVEQARAELARLGERLAEEHPITHASLRGEVVSMSAMAWGMPANPAGDPVMLLMELVPLLLLLVVCGNVGIMILARTASRTGELATRAALGASRMRIVAQLFAEALVLALVATGLGLVAADWAIHRYELLEGAVYPYWTHLGLTPRTALLALGLAVLCAGLASVIPALKATGAGIRGKMGFRGATMRFGRGSTALIVTEVALAVAALSGGVALAVASFQTRADMGIDLDRYLSADVVVPSAVDTPGATAADSAALREHLRLIQTDLKRRIASEPGVRTVAVARTLPGEGPFMRQVEVVGDDRPAAPVAGATVDTDFFRDMGRPVLQGRDFSSADVADGVAAGGGPVIVNTSFVEDVLGGRNPIGRTIRYPGGADGVEYRIVGVVGPLAMNPVNPDRDAGVYHPAGPGQIYPIGLVIEADGDPLDFVPRLRAVAAAVDPVAMIRGPALLSWYGDAGVRGMRFASLVAVLLSAVAIFLSAAGLYALMSFTIAQRTGEIGVRTALGARPWSIVSAIGRRAAFQLVTGVVLGTALSVPLMMDLARIPSLRPAGLSVVVLEVALGTLVVGALACLRPTLRGLRIQPTEALRVE